jgi:hypothetical protein
LKEDQFWEELRGRFNQEDETALGGWCDWFEPKKYRTLASPPCIVGRVGFVDGHRARQWEFRLVLDRSYSSLDEVEWSRQLPPHEADWIAIDEVSGIIEIVASGAT